MFSRAAFKFLGELSANNDRFWFERNKSRYEALVREPALRFIDAMMPLLNGFAPHFLADARKVGGSLMRVHRDTRFSNNKIPYKTNIGIQFRHELGKDVHAPGFYVHLANDGCFFAVGSWRPEADTLWKIRSAIAEHPERWFEACEGESFREQWVRGDDDALIRPPRGFSADHVAIDELKRKSFSAVSLFLPAQAVSPDFAELAARRFTETVPFMRFLCEALNIPY